MYRRTEPVIAPELYQHLTAAQNADHVVKAMRSFLLEGDDEKFELAVAVYVASARYRREQIETVAAALAMLAGSVEDPGLDDDLMRRPTRLHQLIFSGVLRAFYGDTAVDRALGASAHS